MDLTSSVLTFQTTLAAAIFWAHLYEITRTHSTATILLFVRISMGRFSGNSTLVRLDSFIDLTMIDVFIQITATRTNSDKMYISKLS